MDKLDMKDLIYEHLFDLEQDCRFLSIGPGEIITEFRLVAYKGMKQNCENCQFRFECTKGRNICNGKLSYTSQAFDKIFLYAEAFPFIENKFDEVLRILKVNGEIIALVNNERSNKSIEKDLYLSDTDRFTKQINDRKLTIRSISTLKGLKREAFLQFVLRK
jgi:hypothetical protein